MAKRIISLSQFRKPQVAVVAAILALIGWYFVAKSLAGSNYVAYYVVCSTDKSTASQCSSSQSRINGYASEIAGWYKSRVGKTFKYTVASKPIYINGTPSQIYGSGSSGGAGNIGRVYNNLYSSFAKSGRKTVILLGFYTGSSSHCGVGLSGLAVVDPFRSSCPNKSAVIAHEIGHTLLGATHTSDGTLMHAPLACAGKSLSSCNLTSSQKASLANNSYFSGSTSGGGGSPPPSGGSTVNCPTSGPDTSGAHTYIGVGDRGSCVKHAQYILTQVAIWRGSSSVNPKGIDGVFGSNTERAVKAYKVSKGLTNSGIVDSRTWSALHGSCAYMQRHPKTGASCGGSSSGGSSPPPSGSSSGCPGAKGDTSGSHSTVKYGSKSSCVQHLQYILTQIHKWRVKMYGSSSVDPKGVDGSFGPNTKSAVVNYQKGKGITADGIVGPITWGKLHGSCATINKYNFGGSKTYGIKC